MTMKIFSENKSCNCCSNKVFEEIFKINNMPLRTANNFSNKKINIKYQNYFKKIKQNISTKVGINIPFAIIFAAIACNSFFKSNFFG